MFSSRMLSQEGKPERYSSSMPTPVRPPLMRPLGLYSPLMATHCTVTMTKIVNSVCSSLFQSSFRPGAPAAPAASACGAAV